MTYDTVAPTVTVNQKAGQADPTNSLPILWTVTFSETVTGFDASDLTRGGTSTGGTVNVTGSGANYEISLSGTPTNGTTIFSIATNRAQDLAGNNNSASTSTDATVTYDTVAPVVTLTAPANNSFTNDATPSPSGAAGNVAGDSTTVTVRIYSGTDTSGTLVQDTHAYAFRRLLVDDGDGARGRDLHGSGEPSRRRDERGHEFSEHVRDRHDATDRHRKSEERPGRSDEHDPDPVDGDVQRTCDRIHNRRLEPIVRFRWNPLISGSGASYEITLTGTPSQGAQGFTIPAGGIVDLAGNANVGSTSTDNTVTYDTVAPTVTVNQKGGPG